MRRVLVTITPRVTTSVVLKTGAQGLQGEQGPPGPVATWETLTGKPTFATVATSGSYNDLSNKPDLSNLPEQQVNQSSQPFFSDIYTGSAVYFNSDWTEGEGELWKGLKLPSVVIGSTGNVNRQNAIIRDGQNLYFGDATGSNWREILVANSSGQLADSYLSANVSLDNSNNSFTVGQTITAAANTSALTASYSVTGANTTPLLNLSGTWNTTGIARGIFLNITDTASASSSLLTDLQVGGSSRFNVNKTGEITFSRVASSITGLLAIDAAGPVRLGPSVSGNGVWLKGSANEVLAAFGVNERYLVRGDLSIGQVGWSGGTVDLTLARDAANTLGLRNGTNAQTFRVYGTFTDASNGRRLDITSTTAGVVTLTATGNGTGASGNLLKLTAPILLPAASVTLATNGDLAFEATNNTTLTIRYRGSDGTTRSASLALV